MRAGTGQAAAWRPRASGRVLLHKAGRAVGGYQYCDRVGGRNRELYRFELEPEVRYWLDSLSDSDFKRLTAGHGLGSVWFEPHAA
jgi:hypothetical protein